MIDVTESSSHSVAGFEVVTRAEGTVLRVSGELDRPAAARLIGQLQVEVDLQPTALLVDLEDVGFCCAPGFAALLDAGGHAHECGVPFAIVSSQRAVLRPFEKLGLGRVLRLHRDREQAWRWLTEVAEPARS
ncbi:STAS domain-containing protein [Amycolatopsis jiangsuensis]|uniref:Anti-sigma B factor antagonist n=1 Tax=Amycolatopsis jiangsuensis TaxID=1181879 RepID=A0A840J642_9PSEU|nr:STAS domain-containing protein [Amycolatopsis jiangsuensis]MBB4689159.1 anti-sigma B factor antagonist [Amycolatopsis jiangsuensis]